MGQASAFHWLAIKEAATGTFDRANAIATVLGGLILWGAAIWVGGLTMEAPTSVANTILFAALLGAASIGVSWIVVFLIRLYGAPGRLYADVQRTISTLTARLDAIQRSRPFFYSHTDFRTSLHRKNKFVDVGVTVNFLNHGDHMLRWRMLDAFIEVNGKKHIFVPNPTPYFMNRGQRSFFHYPPAQKPHFKNGQL
jgi:hypothetical protein